MVTSLTLGVDSVFITLDDRDENEDAGEFDTVLVTVTSPVTGDSEVITLTETSRTSGIFRNATGLRYCRCGGSGNYTK